MFCRGGNSPARIGDPGKRLHTARSRNDQVAVDLRLYLREEIDEIIGLLKTLGQTVVEVAREHTSARHAGGIPHLQRAQPVTFAHPSGGLRGGCSPGISGGLEDVKKRMNYSPPRVRGRWAGTTYPIDRQMTAEALGFERPPPKTASTGLSDRDYCIELASAALHPDDASLQAVGKRWSSGAAGSLSSSSWTTPSPPAPRSCPRRKTPMSPSWCGGRPEGCTAT